MSLLSGIKRFLRRIIPGSRTYMDKKMKDQRMELSRMMDQKLTVLEQKKEKEQEEILKNLRELLKQQERIMNRQQHFFDQERRMFNELGKNDRELLKSGNQLKQYIGQEFIRRDEWGKLGAQIRREAEDRQVWVIKCPAPENETKVRWGDYPFALALQRCLEELGCYVLVDTKEDWGCEEGADVVLVLRGIHFYRPDRRNTSCLYIMWNISHPDLVTEEEYQLYDVVCVGSRHYAKQLQKKLSVPVVPLLQCTDTSVFYPSREEPSEFDQEYIFIGNSRGIARNCVMWAVEDQLPLTMWGGGWNSILKDHMDLIKAPFIENSLIPELYRNAKVTLNDHWQDMLEKQFVNNRIFDALACGLPVISDTCEELREIFPEAVLHYETREEFEECIKRIETDYEGVRAKVREQWLLIQREYSFEARARQLLELAKKYGSRENRDEKAGCL